MSALVVMGLQVPGALETAECEGIEVIEYETRAASEQMEDAQADFFAEFLLSSIRALGVRQITRRLTEVRALRAAALSELETLLDEEVRLAGMLARMQGGQK